MIVTVHCIPNEKINDWHNGVVDELVGLCGLVLVKNGHSIGSISWADPISFKEESGFRRYHIRCGKCLHHEDFPLLVLAELDD